MKKHILASSLIAIGALGGLMTAALPAQAGSNVGVSISIGEPGFYGRIDLGNAPPPQLIYSQPVLIQRVAAPPPPLYLRVPVGYERNWGRYCGQYGACGRPVYFVRDDWYRNTYVPHYHDHYYGGGWHEARRDRDHDGIPDYRDPDRGHVRDRDRDGIPDNRDRDHGRGWDNRGNDRDHGRGNDRGHDRGNDRGSDRGREHGRD